ncbi:capsid protein precursor [Yak astrovirus]|nr:capsid protein precursor [Yak astrovirus]
MSSWIVFGGEDQKTFLMASRRQQRANPRNTTNIVVRNGPAAPSGGATQQQQQQRRKRRNRRRRGQAPARMPSVPAAPASSRRRQRPNSRIVYQRIVTTLGTVGSNNSDQIETELAVLLNPSTMKEATGSNSYGPLQIYASTYSLFQMRSLSLHLKPLVGASAVSGTIVRMSWNPTNNPTQVSWSALGARKHSDTTPGRPGRFKLTFNDLKGPKDGWYKTMTKGDPMMSFAGTLEVHTLGQTMSTYKNEQFNGGLFLAELETEWQFKDYAQQPGMLNLVKGEDTQQAQITTDGNGKVQLVVPNASRMARAATGSASEIIWLVTDTIIQAGTSVLPPPFGWLIRGGWWLVKRAAGAPVREGQTTFDVYASISDARADMPCISTQTNMGAITVGGLHFQQVTPGNTGISSDLPMARTVDVPRNVTTISTTEASQYKFPASGDQRVPAVCKWYNSPAATTQVSTNGIGFKVGGERVATHNMMRVVPTDGVSQPMLESFPHRIPVYAFWSGNQEALVGEAVAAQYALHQESPALRVSSILFKATASNGYNHTGNWQTATVNYPVSGSGNNYLASVEVPSSDVNGALRNEVVAGDWYVIQFVSIGVVSRTLMVGDIPIVNYATSKYPVGTTQFTPSVSDAESGLLMAYATGFHLQPLPSSVITEQGSLFDIDPSEYYDMPPLESEDEDDEDATDEDLELGPMDDYCDPPMSRLVVHPDAQKTFEILLTLHSEREARLAANQLVPSDEYKEFTTLYHNALADGLSPRAARAHALGL